MMNVLNFRRILHVLFFAFAFECSSVAEDRRVRTIEVAFSADYSRKPIVDDVKARFSLHHNESDQLKKYDSKMHAVRIQILDTKEKVLLDLGEEYSDRVFMASEKPGATGVISWEAKENSYWFALKSAESMAFLRIFFNGKLRYQSSLSALIKEAFKKETEEFSYKWTGNNSKKEVYCQNLKAISVFDEPKKELKQKFAYFQDCAKEIFKFISCG